MNRKIIWKIVKIGVVFLLFLGLLLSIWFLLKPFRAAKASEYLNSENLIGFQKAAILTPLSPLVYLKIGQFYEREGRLEEAEKEFKKIAWLCKNFAWKNPNLRNCPEYKEGYFNLRKIKTQKALEKGDLKEAEAALAEALELNSSDPEVEFYQGIILTAQGSYKEAKKSLEHRDSRIEEEKQILLSVAEKISKSPTPNPYSLMLVGAAFLKMDYQNLAVNQFEKAIRLDPEYRDAYIYLGKAYLQQGDLNKTKEVLEQAAELDPIYPETFYLLSQVYEKLKKPEEAKKALEKAKILGWKE